MGGVVCVWAVAVRTSPVPEKAAHCYRTAADSLLGGGGGAMGPWGHGAMGRVCCGWEFRTFPRAAEWGGAGS